MSVGKLLSLIILILPLTLWSQKPELRFQHINTDNGLSHGFVRAVLQDSEGYAWFATPNGLNRFDGYDMVVYKNDPQNQYSLSSSNILMLFEDSRKNLWIGTSEGINLYVRAENRFVRFPETADGFINSIIEDSEHNLWVSARTALYQYQPSHHKFTKYELHGVDLNITCLFEDSQHNFWLGMLNYVALLDRDKHEVTLLDTLQMANVGCIYEDSKKNLWFGSKGLGILKWETSGHQVKRYRRLMNNKQDIPSDVVLAINEDDLGNVWIGTENAGLIIYDPASDSFHQHLNNPSNEESLSFNSVYAIHFDHHKNTWLGTFKGVELLKQNKFNHISADYFNKNGLPSNNILSFCEDHTGDLWIGTDGGGLVSYDRSTGRCKNFRHDANDPLSLGSNAVTYIYEDRQKNLWVGTWGGGLNLMNRRTGKFKRFMPDYGNKNTIENENIIHIYEDRRDNLWIGTGSGINLLDRKDFSFTHFSFLNTMMSSFPGDVLEDHRGNLWVGASDGLCIFNRDTKAIKTFVQNEKDSASLSNNVVHTLYEDRKGNLWIGTLRGLNVLNRSNNTFKSFLEKDGLPSESIYGIVEDAEGFLWLSTSNGISKFDPVNKVFKNYNVDDGLQGNEFKLNAFYRLKNGEILFGGGNGFNIFDPSAIEDNFIVPPVIITDFRIFNKPVSVDSLDSPLKKHISQTTELVLSHKHDVISFDFAALSFLSPENNQYAYKLEGFEEDWNYVGNKREATYTSLDPGEYVFKVKASNNDGVWNESGTSLKIIITPPFWQTWWFRIIAVAVITLVIHLVIRLRVRRYKNQKRVLEEIVNHKTREIINKNDALEKTNHELSKQKEEILVMSRQVKEADARKLNFFANISHEFRTPLTLILGPTTNLIQKTLSNPQLSDELMVINRNANRLLFLVNELMDFHKLDNDQMKIQVMKTDLIGFFSEVVYSFEEIAHLKDIELSFLPNGAHFMTWFDHQKLEIILYNLISNAFKFTPAGGKITLKLFINTDPAEMEIVVEDDGIGIEEEKLTYIFNRYYQVDAPNAQYHGTGIGLAHTKELIELMDGKIKVFSRPGKGTAFIINLPLIDEERVRNNGKIVEFNPDQVKVNKGLLTALQPMERRDAINSKSHQSCEVLIIDDNEDIRAFVGACLAEKFIVMEASCGESGFVIAKEKLPRLIVCDLMMPGMNGMEFCRQIKNTLATSHIPVVLLTAKTNTTSQIEGFEIGADDYITKPFTKELLICRIDNLIRSREKLRQIFKSKIDIQPKEISVTSADENFLLNALDIIERHISDPEFDTNKFVAALGISRSVVHRKLKDLTDLSTAEFIKTTRLKRASQLLKEKKHRISDICYMVGFTDPHYFGKSFKLLYGVSPTHYVAGN
jgi:signal transduction histidine kinase/ligand-binding sensor domain-containing protein/CheY-like chemotaxis protein/AraC-like DNA-binding protein